MKSIRRAHIVVVGDSDQDLLLAAELLRMDVARVTTVAGIEEAKGLCRGGGTDACIVALGDAVPDAAPWTEKDAPGRSSGVPSLIIVSVVTPYLRKTARRHGYLAVVSATIAPRMLYRRVGAALQWRRADRRRRRMPGGAGIPAAWIARSLAAGNPTLH